MQGICHFEVDSIQGKRKPTPIAWVLNFIASPCLRLSQEDDVAEATSPTQGAVMLRRQQQRRQAAWVEGFMTVAKLSVLRFHVKGQGRCGCAAGLTEESRAPQVGLSEVQAPARAPWALWTRSGEPAVWT
jgi:hypothetical protein